MFRTTIRARIRIGFICVFAVMLAVALYLFVQLHNIGRQTKLLYEHPFQVSNTVKDIKTEVYLNASLSKDILLAQNDRLLDSLKAEMERKDEIIQKNFKIISSQYLGNKKDIDSALSAYALWEKTRNRLYFLKKENKTDSLETLMKYDTRVKFDSIVYFLNIISNFAKNKADSTFKEVIVAENNSKLISIILLIVSGLFVIFFIWFLSRSITKPIKTFVAEANALLKKDEKSNAKTVADEKILLLTLNELKNAYLDIEKQSREIEHNNKQISGMNLELEDRVKQRTLDLQLANEKLSEEVEFRKKAEEALEKQKNKLRAVLDSTPFPVAIVEGKDDKIEFWSRSAFELFGHTAPTASGWYEIAYPDPVYRSQAVEQWKPALEKAKLTGQPVNTGEYNIRCKDGSVRICELYATFLSDNLIVTFNDITERKLAEDKLNLTMTKLADSNKELEQFAYVASHDLQEPLRMVSSYTQLLAKRYKDQLDSEAQEFMAYAVNGATRMQALINDLLDYSRLNTRKKPIDLADCHALLGRVRMNLALMIEEKGAIITSDELPRLLVDESQMVQLLQNLISNGIKYNNKKPPFVHISAKEENNEWIFSIKDNGIGIEPEFYERIFRIFQRLHTRTEYTGTGIGLAICKRIVERHGGRIWLESEPGKGSTFYFSIPK